MKNHNFPRSVRAMAGLTLLALSALSVAAQNSAASSANPNVAETAYPNQIDQIKLSSGVRDVFNLSVAQVSEDTIVSFIEGSTANYNLSAFEIIYLRDQGITDRVITTMLNHRREIAEAQARIAARDQAAAEASALRTRDKDTESETTQDQTSPAYIAPSAGCVVPSSPPLVYLDYSDYYDYYPRYHRYYGGYYPGLSFSFGLGSGYWGGGYHRGGNHGGGNHGGGGHGGGGHGGGGHGGGGHGGGGHGGGHR